MSSKESAAGKLDIYTTASMKAILWEMGLLELTLIWQQLQDLGEFSSSLSLPGYNNLLTPMS